VGVEGLAALKGVGLDALRPETEFWFGCSNKGWWEAVETVLGDRGPRGGRSEGEMSLLIGPGVETSMASGLDRGKGLGAGPVGVCGCGWTEERERETAREDTESTLMLWGRAYDAGKECDGLLLRGVESVSELALRGK